MNFFPSQVAAQSARGTCKSKISISYRLTPL
jgi:hypothetical protein